MLEEFKDDLINVVKESTKVLNDDDALEIIGICRRAADREIASVTEQYLEECIRESESDA